jgi:hypothetical protein
MKWLIVLAWALVTMAACAADNRPGPAQVPSDWRAIFDGRSTDGWRHVGAGELRLEKGELVTHGGMGVFWYTREKFSNCQIRVVFKLTGSNDNSGVFIRLPRAPRDEWDAVNTGYEVQIDNTGDLWHRTGCLHSISRAQNKVLANIGDWNEMLITLFGPRTRVSVNGVPVTDYTEEDPVPPKTQPHEPERGPRPLAGYIGLQNQGEDARVHFKLVAVRPLK